MANPLAEGVIKETMEFVRQELAGVEGGHDWWHAMRVWRLAKHIAKAEKVDSLVVELAALLHDIADSKFHNGDEEIGEIRTRKYLGSMQLSEETIEHVAAIVRNVSWKGGKEKSDLKSLELDIVQDADRLDALGAIGIARTFSYGGFRKREIFNPEIPPCWDMTKEEYKNNTSPTINHFYEKLLLLQDTMNTERGKELAKKRHDYMLDFLDQFYAEFDIDQ